ncbi:MAG TPA: AMP-binding protein [Microthrixaceae bacterium]|nr:AMP-binding protein [Microthrixaceae bacterium]
MTQSVSTNTSHMAPRAEELVPYPETQERVFDQVRAQLERVYEKSPYYRQAFDAAGVHPSEILTPADFGRVPLMDKQIERQCQADEAPFGTHLTVDPSEVVRVHASSGTTGVPTYFALTPADLDMWSRTGSDAFHTMGVGPGDTWAALGNFSMFVGGLPAVSSAQASGACVVPIGASAGTERTLQLIRDLGVNVIGATPSFAIHLGELVERHLGITPAELGIRIIMIGGEPGAQIPAIRQQIESLWNCEVRDAMGMGEIAGTIWAESSDEDGMHLVPVNDVYVELIDPTTCEVLPWEDGATGEVVYTTFTRQATPLIRFRSFDQVEVKLTSVPSGRMTPRVRSIGRSDDMLLVRGMNVFPSAIQDVVASFAPETNGHLRIMLDAPGPLVAPPVEIVVESTVVGDAEREADLIKRIEHDMKARLSFRAEVSLVAPETFERTALKSQLVVIRK